MENPTFISFDSEKEGLVFDDSAHPLFPLKYFNLKGSFFSDKQKSYYGFVYDGQVILKSHSRPNDIILSDGMYFSSIGNFTINSIGGSYVIIEVDHNSSYYKQNNFSPMFTVGGPIEATGRMKYIDGCTDSVLINPIKMGDP
ncbi:MAG: hypothetical protein E6Q36_01195 [Chryseobacterium sp.]|nr:MAG: hypothetical protein E6Q36_01195 [Chryseobacterium sp.]